MLSTLAFAGMIVSTMGHGRLIKPTTRVGHTGYENDPIGFGGRPARQFICRHDAPNNNLTPETFNAGDEVSVEWVTTAAHVGDCALYLSYDGDKALEDMNWFKIANKQDCKSFQNRDMKFDLPAWLPGGNAVLRWEWYALHVYPTIEFYAQCTDIVINPTGQAKAISEIPMFKVFENGQKKSLPLDGNDGVGFRFPFASNDQEWSPSNPTQFMTGPACALDLANSDTNDCKLTAPGTTGHVSLSTGTNPGPSPTEDPSTPEPTEQLPTPDPTMAPVASPTAPTAPTEAPVEAPVSPPTMPPVAAPVSPPTMPPSTGDCTTGLFGEYEQCGGDGFAINNPEGCQLCPSGYQCYRRSNWYSNCNHSCPEGLGWDCESDAAVAPTPSGPPTVPSGPPTVPADGSCPNGEFATCGGIGQAVENCCQEGLTCQVYSVWYSQCVKN